MPDILPGNVEMRDASEDELRFFSDNPNVSGMATADNRVILNPSTTLEAGELEAVKLNEAARVFMNREQLTPDFELTPEQQEAFASYGSPIDIRSTIAARILSGDPSALSPTSEQMKFVSRLSELMGIPTTLSGAIRSRRK
tara:strand:+ start:10666 stop:11088 length:423 start_codon:yes stop_codon:yes gene_type:complete